MENERQVKLYVSNVCFRNMGKGDMLFQTRGKAAAKAFGAYQLCCAFAESSSTYASIVENYADLHQTGIIGMEALEAGAPGMLEGMDHSCGVYTNRSIFFFNATKPETEAQPFRAPQAPPRWHMAYVKKQDGTAQRYYALVNSQELMRDMLLNMAARYGQPALDIVSIRPVGCTQGLWGRLVMTLRKHEPGHVMTARQMVQLMLHGKQDMGIYIV